jgi:hypothetical protein
MKGMSRRSGVIVPARSHRGTFATRPRAYPTIRTTRTGSPRHCVATPGKLSWVIGEIFRVTTFGESHGAGIGAVIDGCPAGLEISLEEIQKDLDRRRPGQSHITTQRKESDTVQIFSGIFENKSQGTPIALFIPNEDAKSKDYDHLKETFRPSHADYTYHVKYGCAIIAAADDQCQHDSGSSYSQSYYKDVAEEKELRWGAFVTQVGILNVGCKCRISN